MKLAHFVPYGVAVDIQYRIRIFNRKQELVFLALEIFSDCC